MQVKERRRREALRRDRLGLVILGFGLLYYVVLGTVLVVYATAR